MLSQKFTDFMQNCVETLKMMATVTLCFAVHISRFCTMTITVSLLCCECRRDNGCHGDGGGDGRKSEVGEV